LAWGLVAASAAGQGAPPAGTQVTTLVEPPGPMLPTNDKLVADSTGAVPALTAEQQAVLKEDGLIRTESRAVVSAKGAAAGWVAAYQFGDATGAYSAYTYFRNGASKVSRYQLPNQTEVELPSGEVVLLSGVNVVRAQLRQYPESQSALLHDVEVGLPKVPGRKSLAPLLPTLFPVEVGGTKLEPNSLRYSIGPAGYQAMGGMLPAEMLGWDKSAEIGTANYAARDGRKGTLTLFLYPTPQIAGDRGRAIEKAINEKGQAAFGTVKLRRLGPLVGMTAGGLTAAQAEALVQAMNLHEEISFDKPMPLEFHAEVKKTATLLQQIAIFTGTLIIAALVIGVFLGGARAAFRVLRGKPAASEPEFLTIDLRDRPKGLFAPKEPGAFEPGPDEPAR
jgi:hypothetical protein